MKTVLTKSRFKVAHECPTKLYYLARPKEYHNTNSDNPFLKALADGGFQVGELAKLYHPGGIEITEVDKEQAWLQTQKLLEQENVIIYEASLKHENLFVKVDLLVKRGNHVELIEVKAKSIDPNDTEQFWDQRSKEEKLKGDWEPYLIDVAFQGYVLKNCYPHFSITHFLMLADKTSTATVNGLNQLFILKKSDHGSQVIVKPEAHNPKALGEKILTKVSVDFPVQHLHSKTYEGKTFPEYVSFLSELCRTQEWHQSSMGQQCKTCEFKAGAEEKISGLQSGLENCLQKSLGLKKQEVTQPLVFDLWDFRKTDEALSQGKIFLTDLEENDLLPKKVTPHTKPGLSRVQRQLLQIEKHSNTKDQTPFFDAEGLKQEMQSWTYPLHFIDFETTMVAIPFHAGRRPYEQIAFQFSHHTVDKDGQIKHQNQYLHMTRGEFPNYHFLRELKKALSQDEGTIFRYSNHENTVLNQIRNQMLLDANAPADKDEFITFIESICNPPSKDEKTPLPYKAGPRCMVDLLELVKRYYYHPAMKGSNSIKKVLPAILSESEFLKEKYSHPVYGATAKEGIQSLNFKDWAWFKFDSNGNLMDPYKSLPPVFEDFKQEEVDAVAPVDEINDGGAAMTAYARMQFSEMSEDHFKKTAQALLKYCELDTLAMVMIYEHWHHLISKGATTNASKSDAKPPQKKAS